MRKPIIAANWKMYKTAAQAQEFCRDLIAQDFNNEIDKVIFAPFTALGAVNEVLSDTDIALGAQNFYPLPEGAYTGEISLGMLKEFSVKYVLVGHSERREILKEDDALIAQKLNAALAQGFWPILCVGESLSVRESGQAHEYCLKQIEKAFKGIAVAELKRIVIAYEPIWAIGTGKSASVTDAQEMLHCIREYLAEQYGEETALELRLIYGGSVKPENIAQFLSAEDIDGALVGSASLDAGNFAKMIRFQER